MNAMKLIVLIIALLFAAGAQDVYAENGKGFVTGRAALPSGKPMKQALAMFYMKQNGPAPLPERYWRVPDAVIPVDAKGKFTAELLEGEYYVGVIGRQSAKLVPGPPVDGDFLILVSEKGGHPKTVRVSDGKTTNVGTHKGSVYRKRIRENIKITSLEGKISSIEGTPVSGAFVFAFHSSERGSRPVFSSDKTDGNGNYVLRVDGEGPFYLKVRDSYGGGKPQPGERIGTFGGDNPIPVKSIIGSSLKEIDIIVQPVQRPGGE